MSTFDYKPIPAFVAFHRSAARARAIIGGFGSGKSYAGVAEAIAIGLEQPGSEILVTRKTVPSLRDSTERIFVSMLPDDFLQQCEVGRAGGHHEHITFPNGTIYYFRGMDDWRKLKSMSLAFILWDEADEFTSEDYEGMSSRLRQTVPTKEAQRLGHRTIDRRGHILASNPRGHNWIWDKFVNPENKHDGQEYWVSSSLDNPFLTSDYIRDLLDMPDPWVRRNVLGAFDEFGGAIYEDWAYDTHVVPPYKDLDGRYKYDRDGFFVMGFDPGTSAGNAAVWCYYDKERHRYVAVGEYNEKGLAAVAHAEEWRKLEARHQMRVKRRVADPVIATRDRGSNMTLLDQYRRLGFIFENGPKRIQDRLPALGQLIHQRRFVVTSDCMQLFNQIQQYRYEDLTPSQVDKGTEAKPLKRDVDLVDAAQYIASRHVKPPKVQLAMSDKDAHQADIQAQIKKQIRSRRNATPASDIGTLLV